jgi:hypothetical protein
LSDNKKELLENLAIAVTLLTGATKAIARIIKKLTRRPKRRRKRK